MCRGFTRKLHIWNGQSPILSQLGIPDQFTCNDFREKKKILWFYTKVLWVALGAKEYWKSTERVRNTKEYCELHWDRFCISATTYQWQELRCRRDLFCSRSHMTKTSPWAATADPVVHCDMASVNAMATAMAMVHTNAQCESPRD